MHRGEQAFREHRYQEARVEFSNVLQDEPANIGAMDKLIRTYLAMEDPVAVHGMLDRMAALGFLPEDAPVLYGEADLMFGRYADALARASQSDTAEAWRVRALAHIGRKEPEQASAAFMNGGRAKGNKSRLLADFAAYRLGRQDMENAARLAEVAVQSQPTALSAYIVNADIAMVRDDREEALKWYERALMDYPESRAAMFGKIVVLADLGRIEKVGPLIKAARKADPKNRDFIYLEARLEAESENWTKVRELLQPMERDIERFPAANMLYAQAMMGLGHGEQARIRLTSHLLREPGNRAVRLLLAEARLAVGDASGAVETMQPVARSLDATSEELAVFRKAVLAANGA